MKVVELPKPGYPMVTRIISNPFLPDQRNEPSVWALGEAHPLDPSAKVVRMFVERGGVAVYYTVQAEGNTTVCLRNFIPMAWVRLVEETMPVDVFVEELALSEAGDSDDGEDEDEDDAPPGPTPANGQAAV